YHPFFRTIKNRGRQIVENPLIEMDGTYKIDFDDLERKIDADTTMIILCNPHNPVGRIWEKSELIKLAEICVKHDIFIVSDEIHSDLIYDRKTHIPFYSLPNKYTENSITFIAPSKTFNLAGLFTSISISGSDLVNKKFINTRGRMGFNHVNIFGVTALKAAYAGGEEWLENVLEYLKGNAEFVHNFLKE